MQSGLLLNTQGLALHDMYWYVRSALLLLANGLR
jgi:hypothetical protein